jgi:PilZ domain
MVETRIELRHRVLKAGTIEFGSSAINCMVRDLSITGAALEVSNQIGIPAKFTLIIPEDGLHLPCNVVRRSGYRIGVAFD